MLIDHALISQFPGIVLYKDKNSSYMSCSTEFACLLGYRHAEAAIGSNDYELPCDAVNNADVYIQEDQQVLMEKRKLSFVQISRLSDGLIHVLYYQKAPFFDLKENKLAGIQCQGFEMDNTFLSNFYKLFSSMCHHWQKISSWEGNYAIESQGNSFYNLSERETQCLFYLIRGKTAKDIANILKLSYRTIESYIENLKSKTHTKSKGELIDFAFQKGYQNKIPNSIFQGLSGACSV